MKKLCHFSSIFDFTFRILQSIKNIYPKNPPTSNRYNRPTGISTPFIIILSLSPFSVIHFLFRVVIVGGARNGEEVYSSQDYENPVVKTFATPLVLEAGEGLRTIVRYTNTTNKMITDGITSEDEMNIMICFQYNP